MLQVVRFGVRLRRPMFIAGGGLLALGMMSSALAQEAEPTTGELVEDLILSLNSMWLMVAAFMVFFMQAGFAMVEAGFVRTKNTTNVLMKNVLDGCFGALAFWAVGFGLAYGVSGDGAGGFFGNGAFFLSGFDDYTTWIFQFAFAATAATIVSGAMAERTKFSAYLVYSVVITALIYPIVVHWAWDGAGWMSAFNESPFMANGYVDFAGSGVVHMVGGFTGLVGAMFVGPRLGKFGPKGEVNPIPGHSVLLGVLGMFILWFGWYGFNPGSTLMLTGGAAALAAKVAVTTTLAAAAGAAVAAVVTRITTGKYDMGLTVNGVLGGLVGITAACATVEPWAAIVIGGIGSLVVMGGVRLLDNLRIDDPVGAVAVHGFAGAWGVLAVGLFSSQAGLEAAGYSDPSSYGLLLGGGASQLIAQVIGLGAILGWVVVTASVLFFTIKVTFGLRVSEEEEIGGLDIGEHGLAAYPEFGSSPFGGASAYMPEALSGGIVTPQTRPAGGPAGGGGS